MGPEDKRGSLLSSWKEISAYLKCSVRTSVRWEKEGGLPVHRQAADHGSRVYAFTEELDEWLAKGPNRMEVRREQARAGWRLNRRPLWLVPLGILAVAITLLYWPRQGPQPFKTGRFSIISSEPASPGRLRVWEITKSGSYRNTWGVVSSRYNTVMHSTIAAGDIDGDGVTELAAPTYVKNTVNRGQKEIVYYLIFVNFYKQGKAGLWKTTFYSEEDMIPEENDFQKNQVILANLDKDPANEILLKTDSSLAVLKYQRKPGEVKLAGANSQLMIDGSLSLKSAAVARLDPSGVDTIVVAANRRAGTGNGPSPRPGGLYFFAFGDEGLKIVRSVPCDAAFLDNALGVGDVNGDGSAEIFAAVTRRTDLGTGIFLLGWDARGEKISDIRLPDTGTQSAVGAALLVADLTFEKGYDVLVGLKPDRLLLYTWQDGALKLLRDHAISTPGISINAIDLADTDSDNRDEIVVGGAAAPKSESGGRFYLEVIGFRSLPAEFFPKWKRVNGEDGEREVTALAIARR